MRFRNLVISSLLTVAVATGVQAQSPGGGDDDEAEAFARLLES